VEWSRVKVYIEQDRQDAASERDAPRFFGVTTGSIRHQIFETGRRVEHSGGSVFAIRGIC
jgi:hypothetical protein